MIASIYVLISATVAVCLFVDAEGCTTQQRIVGSILGGLLWPGILIKTVINK